MPRPDEQWRCPGCGEAFESKQLLETHVTPDGECPLFVKDEQETDVAEPMKGLRCPGCTEAFGSEMMLEAHLRPDGNCPTLIYEHEQHRDDSVHDN